MQGNNRATVASLQSSNKLMGNFPLCTVTIYPNGSAVPVPTGQVFSDSAGSVVLGNPFTADANGYFVFYVADGRYDVKRSGTIPTWTEYDVNISLPYFTSPNNTRRTLQDKASEELSVKDFGASGNGVSNDSTAFQAAVNYICTLASSREITVPPGSYILNATVSIPCSDITIKGSGRLAKITFTGTNPSCTDGVTPFPCAFDTNGKSYVTFEDLFLYGSGTTDEVGIYVNGISAVTTNTQIKNFFIARFGTKPPAITGAAIKMRGDTLSVEIGPGTVEVWGEGLSGDSTTDLANFHDVTYGVSTGEDSGWAMHLINSLGSGAIKIDHNTFVTPGGAMKIGPSGGQYYITNNQHECLGSNPNCNTNAESTTYYLDSALDYVFSDNTANVNNIGSYCYATANFNKGTFERNKCNGAVVKDWWLRSAATALGMTYIRNTNYSFQGNYDTPNYIGIEHKDTANGYRVWGSQYANAPMEFHMPFLPYSFATTLAADITTIGQTTITLTATAGLAVGQIIWCEGEAMLISDLTGAPDVVVTRGHNGTTAATHVTGTAVNHGGAGQFTISGTASGIPVYLSFGANAGYSWTTSKRYEVATKSFIQQPIYLEGLQIQSNNTSINTQVIIKGIAGQADYPFQYQSSTGSRKFSLSNTGAVVLLENNTSARYGITTTGGIGAQLLAEDATGKVTVGASTAHPTVLGGSSVQAPGGAANKYICWKADGVTLGYGTAAEIDAGTCH